MTVAELIAKLQTLDPTLRVATNCNDEHYDATDVCIGSMSYQATGAPDEDVVYID